VKIVYTPQTAADLAEIFDYINERHPPGASNVKRAIHASIGLLEHFPNLGVRTDRSAVRLLAVPRYPYLIFYTVVEERDEIFLINIRHSARQR
jgi:toxin ParE1/3/4